MTSLVSQLSNNNLTFNKDGVATAALTAAIETLESVNYNVLRLGSGSDGTASVKLANLTTPVSGDAGSVAATKGYVDSVASGLDVKQSCRVATTAALATPLTSNLVVSGGAAAVDGVTLAAGDRVLVKNQSNANENGIYIVGAVGGAATRSEDVANGSQVAGAFTFIEEGTTHANQGFVCTSPDASDLVGTNALNFAQFSGSGAIEAGTGLTKSGSVFNVVFDSGFSSTIQTTGTISAGDFNVNTNKMVVENATGNTTIAGTLGVTGQTSLTTLAVSGTPTFEQSIEAQGGLKVNTDKMTVDKDTGNTAVAGTLTTDGTLTSAGNFTVGSNKLTVDKDTGDTAIDGTLGVTGTLSSGDVVVGINKVQIAAASGNTTIAGTLVAQSATFTSCDTTGDLKVNTDKFVVTASSGNTSIDGTLAVTGQISAAGDFKINADKFTVDKDSGDTAIAGTLATTGISTMTGLLRANGGVNVVNGSDIKFAVNATNGNTQIDGTLTMAGQLNADAGLSVDTNNFVVAASGATTIANTLTVQQPTSLQNATCSGTFAVTSTSTFSDNVTCTGTVQATSHISTSDGTLKTDVLTISPAHGLQAVNAMRGVQFVFKDDRADQRCGVIAQEMQKVAPELVKTHIRDGEEKLAVNYGDLTAYLISAIQEQSRQIEALKKAVQCQA